MAPFQQQKKRSILSFRFPPRSLTWRANEFCCCVDCRGRPRIGNSCSEELKYAAIEQMKITELRLAKLFPDLFPEAEEAEPAQAAGSQGKKEEGWIKRTGKILAHVAGKVVLPSELGLATRIPVLVTDDGDDAFSTQAPTSSLLSRATS